MATLSVILACLGYLVLGSVVVCWMAQNTGSAFPTHGTILSVLLLWPLWLIGYFVARYGWRQR